MFNFISAISNLALDKLHLHNYVLEYHIKDICFLHKGWYHDNTFLTVQFHDVPVAAPPMPDNMSEITQL